MLPPTSWQCTPPAGKAGVAPSAIAAPDTAKNFANIFMFM
jgi:hypothetical protein